MHYLYLTAPHTPRQAAVQHEFDFVAFSVVQPCEYDDMKHATSKYPETQELQQVAQSVEQTKVPAKMHNIKLCDWLAGVLAETSAAKLVQAVLYSTACTSTGRSQLAASLTLHVQHHVEQHATAPSPVMPQVSLQA